MSVKKESSDYLIQSVLHALDLLNIFITGHEKEWGVTNLSKQLKLPKNNIFRLLSTLCHQGYAEQNQITGNYRLGIKCFELGQAFWRRMGLVSQAHDLLDCLANECKETVYLSVIDKGEVIYIDMVETPHSVRIIPMVGKRAPLFCTSAGKIQVAYRSQEEIRKLLKENGLKKYTEKTIISESEMLQHLDMVRQQGYTIDNEEFEKDIKCLAAPIRDYTESVIAGICISGPIQRMPEERILNQLIPMIKKVAIDISHRLGYGSD